MHDIKTARASFGPSTGPERPRPLSGASCRRLSVGKTSLLHARLLSLDPEVSLMGGAETGLVPCLWRLSEKDHSWRGIDPHCLSGLGMLFEPAN